MENDFTDIESTFSDFTDIFSKIKWFINHKFQKSLIEYKKRKLT